MKKRICLFDIVNTIILSLVGLVCVVPFLYTFFTAISDGVFLTKGEVTFFPKGVNLESFIYVFTNPRFDVMTGVRNSAIYTIIGTIFSVLLTYSTAYVLTRPRIKFRYFIMSIFILTWVFDAGMIPRYIAYSSLGFIDNIWVMIIPDAINTQYLIITKAYLESMPKELEEAAIVDGANDFAILSKVFLPITKPIIATIALFNGVAIWNQYLVPQMFLKTKELKTIQQVLANVTISTEGTTFANTIINGISLNQQNMKAAAIIIAMLPIVIAYPFVQKYFRNGILIGSVKG